MNEGLSVVNCLFVELNEHNPQNKKNKKKLSQKWIFKKAHFRCEIFFFIVLMFETRTGHLNLNLKVLLFFLLNFTLRYFSDLSLIG